jgi:hypothetical protein
MKLVEDVVLYHGSLEELNSRRDYPKRYAPILKNPFFISKGYEACPEIESYGESAPDRAKVHNLAKAEAIEYISKEIQKKGYAGLVNTRTLLYTDYGSARLFMTIEGTPIQVAEDMPGF